MQLIQRGNALFSQSSRLFKDISALILCKITDCYYLLLLLGWTDDILKTIAFILFYIQMRKMCILETYALCL